MNNSILIQNDVNSLQFSSSSISSDYGIINASIGSHTKNSSTNSTSFRENIGEFVDKSSLPNTNDNDDFIIEIFRFKFTKEFMEELYQFSKIHQFLNRKDFKEAWIMWEEKNSLIIQAEIDRLNHLDFHGDILDKMFKSARYYFRKRVDNVTSKDCNKIENRKYQCSSKLLLETIEQHIKTILCKEDSVKKPSIAFLDFCKVNKDLLKDEILDLNKQGIIELKDIQIKIKKTYKNKYFSILHK